ncbi:MAG: TRAP transporter small permease [Halorhodospira sp.]
METGSKSYLERLDRATAHVEAAILGLGVLALAVFSIANTLSRNLLDSTVPGTSEITELLMIWITFGGVAYGVRRARHICMNAFYDQLRGRLRKGLLVATHLLTGALLLYLSWYAADYVLGVHNSGRSTTALGIPLGIAYTIVPLGLLAGGVQYLLSVWRNLTSSQLYRSYSELERYEDEGGGGGAL